MLVVVLVVMVVQAMVVAVFVVVCGVVRVLLDVTKCSVFWFLIRWCHSKPSAAVL